MFDEVLSSRVSLDPKEMTGGEVLHAHLQQALVTVASVPVHGRKCPYHYVIFAKDSIEQAKEMVYPLKAAKQSREVFDETYKGVGTFLFAFCKKASVVIPMYEHEWSAACGMYAIQLSLFNAGYATKWNSIYKDSPHAGSIVKACGLEDAFIPIGYLVVGTGVLHKKVRLDSAMYSTWK